MTYCPLTDTALLFDTGFDPDALPRAAYYTPAGLFNSNLSVGVRGRPRELSSAYNQMLGWGISGPDAHRCLERLPAYQVEFNIWERMHPDTWILHGDPALADWNRWAPAFTIVEPRMQIAQPFFTITNKN